MTKLSKVFAVAIVAFVVMGLASAAKAAKSQEFTINVTVKFLKIDILSDTGSGVFSVWNIGGAGSMVELGQAYSMGVDEGIQVNYVSNVDLDISTVITNQGANWTAFTAAGAPPADQFKLEAKINDAKSTYAGAAGAAQAIGTTDVVLNAAQIAAATGSKFVYYQLTTPADLSDVSKADGSGIKVTLKVAAH